MFKDLAEATTKTALAGKIEQKGQFDYLSWAHAVHEIAMVHKDFTFEVKHFPQLFTRKEGEEVIYYTLDGVTVPFNRTSAGYFVEVEVTAGGVKRTQVHPVLDNRNQPIGKPTSFQINTSIQRALAKAIALHGVGLSLYAGEDLV